MLKKVPVLGAVMIAQQVGPFALYVANLGFIPGIPGITEKNPMLGNSTYSKGSHSQKRN